MQSQETADTILSNKLIFRANSLLWREKKYGEQGLYLYFLYEDCDSGWVA